MKGIKIIQKNGVQIYKMTPVQYKNYCTEKYGGGTLRNKCSMYFINTNTGGEGYLVGDKYYYSDYINYINKEFNTEEEMINEIVVCTVK